MSSKLSSKIMQLKFMQRAKEKKELEQTRKEQLRAQVAQSAGQASATGPSEQAAAATREPLGATPSTGEAVKPRCVVVYESDPQPGAFMGRMSFQSFNPATERLATQIEAEIREAASAARARDDADVSDVAMASTLGQHQGRRAREAVLSAGDALRGEASGNAGPKATPGEGGKRRKDKGASEGGRRGFQALVRGGDSQGGAGPGDARADGKKKAKRKESGGYMSLSSGAAPVPLREQKRAKS